MAAEGSSALSIVIVNQKTYFLWCIDCCVDRDRTSHTSIKLIKAMVGKGKGGRRAILVTWRC
jgi:hypothetical protein